MSTNMTHQEKLEVVLKALDVSSSELFRFMGMGYSNSPPWTVVFDSSMAVGLLDQLYMLVDDNVPAWQSEVLKDVRDFIKEGGTVGSLLRKSLLYQTRRP
jgi:hypothetical protein